MPTFCTIWFWYSVLLISAFSVQLLFSFTTQFQICLQNSAMIQHFKRKCNHLIVCQKTCIRVCISYFVFQQSRPTHMSYDQHRCLSKATDWLKAFTREHVLALSNSAKCSDLLSYFDLWPMKAHWFTAVLLQDWKTKKLILRGYKIWAISNLASSETSMDFALGRGVLKLVDCWQTLCWTGSFGTALWDESWLKVLW